MTGDSYPALMTGTSKHWGSRFNLKAMRPRLILMLTGLIVLSACNILETLTNPGGNAGPVGNGDPGPVPG